MKRNCYLNLHRLHTSSVNAYSPLHRSMNETLKIHNKLVAILHNGRHCIFDTAELQARVIIWLASREMGESTGLHSETLLIHVSRGLSIKKSLQNFLKRRKKRSQSNISIVTHNDKN